MRQIFSKFGRLELGLAVLIGLTTVGILFYKVRFLGYTIATIEPEKGYFVKLVMGVEGHGRDVNVTVTMPVQSERQRIRQEQHVADRFRYSISRSRQATWHARNLRGKHRIAASFFAQTEAREYPLPRGLKIPLNHANPVQKHLSPSEWIQADHAEIVSKAQELIPEGAELGQALQNAYNFVYARVTYKKIRGPTDALTALRLREASCNGKNRLLIALLRARGIPARMADGLILENTSKRTTHSWTEVLVADTWVPLCPSNGYFARIPEHYLELGKGDQPIFIHSKHIGFDWKWIVQPQLTQTEQAVWSSVNNPLNILNHWGSLKDFHIPLRLIMIVLMVPVAATVVSFTRNVIGLIPFGTFMPALIAVSFQDTGFLIGSTLFFCIVVVSSLVNFGLVKLRILHIPRLVILLTFVVISIMAVSILSIKLGLGKAAAVSLFPMAILTLTSERFSQLILEDSWKEAVKRMCITYVVSSACFYVISLTKIQLILAAFPELLLGNIALNLVIGSWSGLRLLEYYRFRHVLGQVALSEAEVEV